jgi:hypothetical protein
MDKQIEFPLPNGVIISMPEQAIIRMAKGKLKSEVWRELGLEDEGYTLGKFCHKIRRRGLADYFREGRRRRGRKKEEPRTKGTVITSVACYNAPYCDNVVNVPHEEGTKPPSHVLCCRCKISGSPQDRLAFDEDRTVRTGLTPRLRPEDFSLSRAEIERIRHEITPFDQCRVAGTMTAPGESSIGGKFYADRS